MMRRPRLRFSWNATSEQAPRSRRSRRPASREIRFIDALPGKLPSWEDYSPPYTSQGHVGEQIQGVDRGEASVFGQPPFQDARRLRRFELDVQAHLRRRHGLEADDREVAAEQIIAVVIVQQGHGLPPSAVPVLEIAGLGEVTVAAAPRV